MTTQPRDADFAASLASLANGVAPSFSVDTSRVIRTARRRREWRRSATLGVCGFVAFTGVGATQLWQPTVDAPTAVVRKVDAQPTGEPSGRGVAIAPAISPLQTNEPVDSATEPAADKAPEVATEASANNALPTAVPAGLVAVGALALGTAGFFAVRARKLA